jgi:hypothetical protein
MNDEIRKAVQKSRAAAQIAHPQQRHAFKALLLSNPNYFGNLSSSPFKPVLPISGNTHYEELGCVGYHPQQQKLAGVVYVYQTSGYGSGICGGGSTEFVRFYLSFDNGASWIDQGMTSFQAYDIAAGTEGSKRLEYAVSLAATPPRKFCFVGNHLIRVRAILSWNNPPPPNQPNWVPVWGNAREATIQVEPRRLFFPTDLLKEAKVKLPNGIGELLDLDAPIAPKQKALGAQELAIAYKDKGVPMHRFAFKELSAFATGKSLLSAELLQQQLPQLQIDPSIIDVLFPKTDGDISYEELTCIGLDPNSPDTLVGVVKVKKASGYSGGPCTQGSREYVSWWADIDNNGSFETFLGTAEVRVYDLDNIPPEGVHYAVRLPVDLGKYRKDCHAGPVVLKIRATLSWNAPVPGNNPNHVPTWGNREETLIHVAPTTGVPAGRISHIGSVLTPFIDDVSGLTLPGAQFAHNGLTLPDACPFARRVTLRGFAVEGFKYKVEVVPVDAANVPTGAPTPVVTSLTLERQNLTTYTHNADPATKLFEYKGFTDNINTTLAHWDTTGDDRWLVTLQVYDSANNPVGLPDKQVVQLHNSAPDVFKATIFAGAGDCGKFPVGSVLQGNFVARDVYLSGYNLTIDPPVNATPIGVPVPSAGTTNTVPLPGDAWSLDTTGMRPCGYVLRVTASNRAIVNSAYVGLVAQDTVGFCLEASPVVE